jgi:hypothetical protein
MYAPIRALTALEIEYVGGAGTTPVIQANVQELLTATQQADASFEARQRAELARAIESRFHL